MSAEAKNDQEREEVILLKQGRSPDEEAVVVPKRLIMNLLNELARARANLAAHKTKEGAVESVTEDVQHRTEFIKGGVQKTEKPEEVKEEESETVVETRLNPDISEDDIAYDIEVDKNDELGEAKLHVHHAESRIHALRARLRKKKKSRTSKKETELKMVPDKEKIFETRTITKIIKETSADIPAVNENVDTCEKIAREMLKGPNFGDANAKDSEKVSGLQSELLSKTTKISKMESDLKSKDADLVAQQNAMQEKQVELKKNQDLLTARDSALKEKEGELEKTRAQLNDRDELMLQHEEEWQEKLLNADMKFKELQSKMDADASGQQTNQEEINKIKKEKVDLEAQNDKLLEQTGQLKGIQAKLESMETSRKEIEEELRRKEALLLELQNKNANGDTATKQQTEQIKALQARTVELTNLHNGILAKNNEMKGYLLTWQSRYEKEQHRSQALEHNAGLYTGQIGALKTENQKLKLEIQELLLRLGQVEQSLVERRQKDAYKVITGKPLELETMVTSVVDLRSMDHKIYEAQVLPEDKWREDVPIYRKDHGKTEEVTTVHNWQDRVADMTEADKDIDMNQARKAVAMVRQAERQRKERKRHQRRPSMG